MSQFDSEICNNLGSRGSSVLAWRIPGMGESGGLPSLGSHRIGHDWSDLAAAGSWGPLSYGHLVRSAGTKLDLWLVPEGESGPVGLNSLSVESDAISQSCLTLCNPLDCNSPGSSVHGISQERILDGVAISFSWGSSWARNQTQHCRRILYAWVTSAKMGSELSWVIVHPADAPSIPWWCGRVGGAAPPHIGIGCRTT